jgi:hypothetical protein
MKARSIWHKVFLLKEGTVHPESYIKQKMSLGIKGKLRYSQLKKSRMYYPWTYYKRMTKGKNNETLNLHIVRLFCRQKDVITFLL